MTSERRPLIAITLGDPCGIGPEVVAKALMSPGLHDLCHPLVIGSAWALEQAMALVGTPLKIREVPSSQQCVDAPGTAEVLDPHNLKPSDVTVGRISAEAGRASAEWVIKAAELCLSGQVQAMATAPIHKEAVRAAGYHEVGHTELLQRLTEAPQVATMLASGHLRVVHLTTHRSLRRACDYVTKDNILAKLELTHRFFQGIGLSRPRIGVAALNPHGSDGGLLGDEEEREIRPAVEEAQRRSIDAIGPAPADSVFVQAVRGRYDVVLCMYHDQGHIAVKVHGFERSFTVTLGLPFIRTSADHGTAFDIAGKGIADAQSMTEAIRVAASLASSSGLMSSYVG